MSNNKAAAFARAPVVIERSYRARAEDLWELWTTKQGFESWWGPEGFRVEVHAIDARAGGLLHYDMIADTPEMIAAMRRMGRPPSHGTRARFVELDLHRHIVITHVIDFLPGVQAYDSTLRVDFCASGDCVRMVVTLEPMHDQAFTDMSAMGFSSQLGKLNALRAYAGSIRNDIAVACGHPVPDVCRPGRGSHDLVRCIDRELSNPQYRALWRGRPWHGRLGAPGEILVEWPRIHLHR